MRPRTVSRCCCCEIGSTRAPCSRGRGSFRPKRRFAYDWLMDQSILALSHDAGYLLAILSLHRAESSHFALAANGIDSGIGIHYARGTQGQVQKHGCR